MANIVRVKVELKKKYNDPAKNEKEMIQEFKRRVNSSGLLTTYKEHQVFESKSSKARKKKREQVKKHQMEQLEYKILAGEKVNARPGVVKKVMANINKDRKDRKKDRRERDYEDQN